MVAKVALSSMLADSLLDAVGSNHQFDANHSIKDYPGEKDPYGASTPRSVRPCQPHHVGGSQRTSIAYGPSRWSLHQFGEGETDGGVGEGSRTHVASR